MNHDIVFNSIYNLKRTIAILSCEREVLRIELGGDMAADLNDVIKDVQDKVNNMEAGVREDRS